MDLSRFKGFLLGDINRLSFTANVSRHVPRPNSLIRPQTSNPEQLGQVWTQLSSLIQFWILIVIKYLRDHGTEWLCSQRTENVRLDFYLSCSNIQNLNTCKIQHIKEPKKLYIFYKIKQSLTLDSKDLHGDQFVIWAKILVLIDSVDSAYHWICDPKWKRSK